MQEHLHFATDVKRRNFIPRSGDKPGEDTHLGRGFKMSKEAKGILTQPDYDGTNLVDYVHESTLPDEIKYARRYLVNTIFVGANDDVKVELFYAKGRYFYTNGKP